MPRHHSVSSSLSLAAALVAAAVVAGDAPARDVARQAPKAIATVSTGDFRVDVTATRVADPSGAPTAVVTATISKRLGRTWQRTASHPLKSTHFWYTVTGPLSVCRLEIRTTAARAGFRPYVAIQLLRSPSIGCGPTHRFLLT